MIRIIDNDVKRCQNWVAENYHNVGFDLVQTIGLEQDGKITAVIGYNYFNDVSCHVHVYIKKGVWIPKQFLWFAFYYPFNQLGLQVIVGLFNSSNGSVLKLANRFNFKQRCELPEINMMLFTLKKEDCKILRNHHG